MDYSNVDWDVFDYATFGQATWFINIHSETASFPGVDIETGRVYCQETHITSRKLNAETIIEYFYNSENDLGVTTLNYQTSPTTGKKTFEYNFFNITGNMVLVGYYDISDDDSLSFENFSAYYPGNKVTSSIVSDDENNFILNHKSSNRNPNKMNGFYNGEYIILRSGEVKRINITFPKYNGWKDIPYKFRISCLNTSMSAPFYLHVNIAKKQETQEDARRISKGVTCLSFDAKEIEKYLGIHKKNYDNKAEMCIDVMQKLIDKQAENMEDRNLYTPFEK